MSSKSVFVRKAGGELEQFQSAKLRASLRKSGADESSIERVMKAIVGSVCEGMKTRDIYRMAYKVLRRQSRPVATRYRLRQALMELGPSGYPFERLIGQLFRAEGYRVQIGVVVPGRCVNHEVDVLAEMDHTHSMAECKYHNRYGEKSDVKTAMYVSARFDDIRRKYADTPVLRDIPVEAWLVTNTKFSTDAIAFGSCIGLQMMAWGYPAHKGLQERIEKFHLYPVTSLTSLTPAQKRILLNEGAILYSDIISTPEILKQCNIGEDKMSEVYKEVEAMMDGRPAPRTSFAIGGGHIP